MSSALGLNFGELFLVTFITVAVVSARYWPQLGQRLAEWLSGTGTGNGSDAGDRPSQPTPGPPG